MVKYNHLFIVVICLLTFSSHVVCELNFDWTTGFPTDMSDTISAKGCSGDFTTLAGFFNGTTGYQNFHSSNPTLLPYGLCDGGDYKDACETLSKFILMLGQKDIRSTAVSATAWFPDSTTEAIDFEGGFETRFSYLFTQPLKNATSVAAPLGTGFFFGIQGSNPDVCSSVSNSFGVIGLAPYIGFSATWSNTNNNASPTIKLIAPQISGVTTTGTGYAPFLGNATQKTHTFTVTYDTLVSPPLFRVYGNVVPGNNDVNNATLLLSARVKLRDYYHPSNPNVVAPTYIGFGQSSSWGTVNNYITGYVPNWGMRYYELNDNLVSWCDGGYDLYLNGTKISSSTTSWTSFSGDTLLEGYTFTPGTVIAFRANSTSLNAGCMIDLRFNQANTFPNTQSYWKCSNSAPAGWEQASFDSSSWSSAQVLGTNTIDETTFRHISNIYSTTPRIWASNTNQQTYCRLTIPRYCFDNASTCVGMEVCQNNYCYCDPSSGYYGEFCDLIGNPAINTISPNYGTALGGTIIKLQTNNISRYSDYCSFNGVANQAATNVISPEETWCTIPAGTAGQTITIAISRSNSQIVSNSVQFTYTTPIAIYSSSPSAFERSDTNRTIFIKGANFENRSDRFYYCRFPALPSSIVTVEPATVVSSSLLTCEAPRPNSPTISTVEVSNNNVDWVNSANVTVRFTEFKSPFCLWYDNSPVEEFPFVETEFPFFSENLAFGQGVTVTPNSYDTFNGSQVTDQDFCCSANANQEGCGIVFNTNVYNVSVNISLPKMGQFQEIVTSWFNPCFGLPTRFTISAFDESLGYLVPLTTVSTSSCISQPSGGSGAASICVNYLPSPVISDLVEISFSNADLQPDSTGAALYEITVQGIFLDQPFSLGVSNTSTWVPGTSQIFYGTQSSITFPSFELELYNIIGKSQGVTNYSNLTVTMELKGQGTLSSSTSLTRQYMGDPTLFDDVILVGASLGNYSIIFTSNNLESLTLDFMVTPGPPAKVKISPSEVTVAADSEVAIPPITLCFLDAIGNPTTASSPVYISAIGDSDSTNLTGVLNMNVTSGSCVTFSSLSLGAPASGIAHAIIFSADSITGGTVNVIVTPGQPKKLVFITKPNNVTDGGDMLSPYPELKLVDFLNVAVTDPLAVAVDVQALGTTFPAKNVTGNVVTISNGVVDFSKTDFSFVGQYGGFYNLHFYYVNNTAITADFAVYIRRCEEQTSRPYTVTSFTGYECQCISGYGLNGTQCLECDVNYFKSEASNDACSPCDISMDTDGKRGSYQCTCKSGLYNSTYYAPDSTTTDICRECPEGGVCTEGKIVGTQKGYWRPSDVGQNDIKFYPCTRNTPTDKEIQASYIACPGDPSRIVTDCANGYDGIRCLVCAEGYGALGTYCTKCPKESLNWLFLAFCFLVILIMLIFLVIQGRTPKNKESVSSKILLNHIQMLALLSAVGAAWTDPFLGLLTVGGVGTLVDSRIVTTDCAIRVSFYYKFAGYIAIPLVTVIVSGLVHLIIFLIKGVIIPFFQAQVSRTEVRRMLTSQYVLSLTVITFITYPAICIKVLEVFDCSISIDGPNGDQVYFLNADPTQQCGTSRHTFYSIFAYIMLVIYCVGVPFVSFIMLWKYRNLDNPHVQMILRFFYDGFKNKHYFWEIVNTLRKFLIAIAIIIARIRGAVYQLYGFVWIIQAALLLHIVFRPYISGRQFRLELWSLLAMLITLGASLYIPTLAQDSAASYTISGLVFALNIIVIGAFLFFIFRGIMRRFFRKTWENLITLWNSYAPKRMQKGVPNSTKVRTFFELFAGSEDEDKQKFFVRLEEWWAKAPNYQRRRLMVALLGVSKGTFLEKFSRRDSSNPMSRGSYYSGASSFYSSKRGSVDLRTSVSPNGLSSYNLATSPKTDPKEDKYAPRAEKQNPYLNNPYLDTSAYEDNNNNNNDNSTSVLIPPPVTNLEDVPPPYIDPADIPPPYNPDDDDNNIALE